MRPMLAMVEGDVGRSEITTFCEEWCKKCLLLPFAQVGQVRHSRHVSQLHRVVAKDFRYFLLLSTSLSSQLECVLAGSMMLLSSSTLHTSA